jgi:hypothetical protein
MSDVPDPAPTPPDARLVIELTALRAGAASGCFGVLCMGVVHLLAGRRVDDVAGTLWVYAFFGVAVFAYALAGYAAGRARPAMPLAHGIIAGFIPWMALRTVIVLVRDSGTVLAWNQLAVNLVLGPTFGMFGAMFAARYAPTPRRP